VEVKEKTKENVRAYLNDYFKEGTEYFNKPVELYLAVNVFNPLKKRDFNNRLLKVETAIKNGDSLASAIELFFPVTPIQIRKKEREKIALTGNLSDWGPESIAKLCPMPSVEELRERAMLALPIPNRKLNGLDEYFEFTNNCKIDSSELVKKCKVDPDFVLSLLGICNIRRLRAELFDKDEETAKKAKRTLEAIGKCLALKGWKDKPRKIEKTVLIQERDRILNAIVNSKISLLQNVNEKKQIIEKLFGKKISGKLSFIPSDSKVLANVIVEIKYGYSGSGEIVNNYEKDVTKIDCGNGNIAYRLKPTR